MAGIDPNLLHMPVEAVNLHGASLHEHLQANPEPLLVAFLRHLSCMFCREMVRDIRAASESTPGYPPVVLVCPGDRERTTRFLEQFWPGVAAICDAENRLHDAAGVGRATSEQVFGPRVWACGLRAMAKGNLQGRPIFRPASDPWAMPGAFLIRRDGSIIWQHFFEHIGDKPDWQALPAIIRGRAGATVPGRLTAPGSC